MLLKICYSHRIQAKMLSHLALVKRKKIIVKKEKITTSPKTNNNTQPKK